MIRRAVSVLVLAAVVSGFGSVQAFAEETRSDNRPRGYFGIGAGLGIRYGSTGVGIEVSPVEYVAVTAGAGLMGIAGGYSLGLELFPAGRSRKLRPWLSVSAGEIVAATPFGGIKESFTSFGVGGEVGFGSKHTMDFGIDLAEGKVLFPTIGWKYHF